MKYLIYLWIIYLFSFPAIGVAQQARSTIKEEKNRANDQRLGEQFSRELLDSSWNRIRNSSYAAVIGAQGNTNSIGNYGSLDPLNGSLSFKGVIPMGRGSRVSYLSLQGTAELISNGYAAIFTNTRLNTNAAIQGEYNIRIGARKSISDGIDEAHYLKEEGLVFAKKMRAIEDFKSHANQALDAKRTAELEIKAMDLEIVDQKTQLSVELDALEIAIKAKKITGVTTPLQTKINGIREKIIKLEKSVQDLVTKNDELELLIEYKSQLINYTKDQEEIAYQAAKYKLQQAFRFTSQSFWWLTLTAGTGRKDYNIYDKSQPFGSQITNPYTSTFKLGVAVNFFSQNNLSGKAFLFNGGFQRLRDNNLSSLSTQELNQEVAYKNSIGDTTRKLSKKITVYSSGVEEFRQWNIYTNLYYILDGGRSGLHFFPSYYKTEHRTGYLDFGIGFVLAFRNTKSGSSDFNLEGYIIFNDAFDSLNLGTKILDRNNIGIRATFPFEHLFKP